MEVLVPIASTFFGAMVAILVPVLTFAHNRKLERIRLLDTERKTLYVDAITECYAEQRWVEQRVHDRLYGDDDLPRSDDIRLDTVARARLGARMDAFAEPAVRDAFNQFNAVAGQYFLARTEEDVTRLRMQLENSLNDLARAVRGLMTKT